MAFDLRRTEMCLENYEPPLATRNLLWKHTKKQSYVCGAIQAPGLLDYDNVLSSLLCFMVVLFFEFLGLSVLILAGMNQYFVISLGLIDLLFAILQHLPAGRILELKNLHCLAKFMNLYGCPEAPPPRWTKSTSRRVFLWQVLRGVLALPIILVGVIRIMSYYSLMGAMTPQVFLLSVICLIIAMIHIFRTGYFIYWLFAEIADFFQYRSYKSYLEKKLSGAPGVVVPHEIVRYRAHNFTYPSKEFEWRIIDRHVLIAADLLYLFLDKLPPAPAPWPCNTELNDILNNLCSMNGPRSVYLPQRKPTGPYGYVLLTWGILTDWQVEQSYKALNAHPGIIIEAIRHQIINIMSIREIWNPPGASVPGAARQVRKKRN